MTHSGLFAVARGQRNDTPKSMPMSCLEPGNAVMRGCVAEYKYNKQKIGKYNKHNIMLYMNLN